MTALKVEFVSIVIPAFNEEKYIESVLQRVLLLDYPREMYEVIIVDNGSTDKTVDIARKYTDKVYVYEGVKVGAVRNFGASKARGDYIAFLDSDCIPPMSWLGDAFKYMDDNRCDVVGGTCLLREDPTWVETSWVINQDPKDQVNGSLMGGSILIKKSVFSSVGGFDESMSAGEDSALGDKLIASGYAIHIAKCCAFVHLGYPRDLREFTKRQFWHASSYLRSRKKRSIDYILLLSLVFLVFILLIPIGYIYSFKYGVFMSLLLLALPILLTLKRAIRARFLTYRIDSYLKMYVLDFCYLLGRSGGLAKSILVELNIITDKKSHY